MTKQEVYEKLCAKCIDAKKCHDDCVTCEAFDKAVESLNKPRLIDVNKLNRDDLCDLCGSADCTNCFPDEAFEQWLHNQPTAYDIDEVVEQLKEQENENGALGEIDWYAGLAQGFHEAIEIVKGGGKHDD